MDRRTLILASASPARLRLLRHAGLDPKVIVSGVDEDRDGSATTDQIVLSLAQRKAIAVADVVATDAGPADADPTLVVGCDSLLDVDGTAYGKPAGTIEATLLWHRLRGGQATLFTGHCIIDTAQRMTVSEVGATIVRFGTPSDAEIDAYVATGEPLEVAGGFTLDGRSAPFVDGIDGDPGNVLGLSLPVFRRLLGRLDVQITDLWC